MQGFLLAVAADGPFAVAVPLAAPGLAGAAAAAASPSSPVACAAADPDEPGAGAKKCSSNLHSLVLLDGECRTASATPGCDKRLDRIISTLACNSIEAAFPAGSG